MTFNIEFAQNFIQKNLPLSYPKYFYSNENSTLNPAYEDISNNRSYLTQGAIRIWALRGDMILATGIKNAYQKEFGYTEFQETFFDKQHLLNPKDRYGHPSLTQSELNDVGAYTAGYLKLTGKTLKVFFASGRYFSKPTSKVKIFILESYLSHLFGKAYNIDKVIFYHGMKDYNFYKSDEDYYQHLSLFFKANQTTLLANEPQRHYELFFSHA